MLTIVSLMDSLREKRPIFHSEADFQHAFAWELHRQSPNASVRLERPVRIGRQALHLDIWVEDRGECFAVELKYKTHRLEVSSGSELFTLQNQSALPLGRYDFLKDIQRLEQVVAGEKNAVAYAVLLTNDSAFWVNPPQSLPVDPDCRLHEGRVLEGTLQWGAGAGEGTKKGREEPLTLGGKYSLTWRQYSKVSDERYELFRYLAIKVVKTENRG